MLVDKIDQEPSPWGRLGLLLAWELGYSITIPLVLFALIGRLLDRRFVSAPLFLLVGLVLAVITTTSWLTMRLRKMLQEYHKLAAQEPHRRAVEKK